MKEKDLDERLIHAVASHGYGLVCDIEPEHEMEKVLFGKMFHRKRLFWKDYTFT